MTDRHLDLFQKYTELQKAFDDTLEMNRKFGTENVRLEKENEQLKKQLTKGRDILFEFVKIACETFSEGCPECDYCFLGEVKQKAEVFFKELLESQNEFIIAAEQGVSKEILETEDERMNELYKDRPKLAWNHFLSSIH